MTNYIPEPPEVPAPEPHQEPKAIPVPDLPEEARTRSESWTRWLHLA